MPILYARRAFYWMNAFLEVPTAFLSWTTVDTFSVAQASYGGYFQENTAEQKGMRVGLLCGVEYKYSSKIDEC